jgi:AraC family transcriptional activator of tynA and feaB
MLCMLRIKRTRCYRGHMQAIDDAQSALVSATPTASFRHWADDLQRLSGPSVHSRWRDIAERHLICHLREADRQIQARFDIPEDGSFEGQARSGRFGNLKYARFRMSRSIYQHRCNPCSTAHHRVLVCARGKTHVHASGMSALLEPGDFVLVRDIRHVRVEHDQPAENVLLLNPLSSDELQRWSDRPLVHRPSRTDGASMLSRLIQDACEDGGWRTPEAAASLDLVVRSLLREVLMERAVPGATVLSRGAIEGQVVQRLQDPSLSLRDIADFFSCSVRTLHRVFRGDSGGGESLERFIQRERIEACARRLKRPWDPQVRSITDLALQYGFSSSSHFSTAFRAAFDVSPSAYRRMHLLHWSDAPSAAASASADCD